MRLNCHFLLWITLAIATPLPVHAAGTEAVQLPPLHRMTLSNGVTLLLVEKHDLPLVSFHFVQRAGGVADPDGLEGLAAITVEMLQRGTAQRKAVQIARDLDAMGGVLALEAHMDFARGAAEVLAPHATNALKLLAELLREPAFPQDELTKLLEQSRDAVLQMKDEPREVLRPYYRSFLYGAHPYGRPLNGDEQSLTRITRNDVVRFWKEQYRPENLILSVVGDFKAADLAAFAGQVFGGGNRNQDRKPSAILSPATNRAPRLLLVNKADATQTFFAIGGLGIARTNAQRAAVDVVNTIFGGRFTSMLNDALRVNSGLTYGAGSRFDPLLTRGSFAISSFTRTEKTVEAIDLAVQLLEQLHREGISEAQLLSARAYLKGQFPQQIESIDQLAGLLAELEFYHLGPEEISGRFKALDAVTTESARRAIEQFFPRTNLTFVLMGQAQNIRSGVEKYGALSEVEIDAPGFYRATTARPKSNSGGK